MRTTIDSAGRVVIPREIRTAAGLQGGAPIEIEFRDGAISIEPVPAQVRIVRRGRVPVIVHEGDVPVITEEMVNAVRDGLRNRR